METCRDLRRRYVSLMLRRRADGSIAERLGARVTSNVPSVLVFFGGSTRTTVVFPFFSAFLTQRHVYQGENVLPNLTSDMLP
jgi:hypothetical protein